MAEVKEKKPEVVEDKSKRVYKSSRKKVCQFCAENLEDILQKKAKFFHVDKQVAVHIIKEHSQLQLNVQEQWL